MCSITKQLDSYSMLIVSKYFRMSQDYINVVCVCKKFKETTEKLRFNPISITSLKLFPKIQTQYLYDQNDKKLDIVEHHEIWYEVNYEEYLKYKENNIKCHHITYTTLNFNKYGYTIPKEVTILKECFYNSYRVINLSVSNRITTLGDHFCFNRIFLSNIQLPPNLIELNEYCFSGCTSLTSINIPTSIQSINRNCFSFCSMLLAIELPNSLTSIGNSCFEECRVLKSINIPTSILLLESQTFENCRSLKNVKLPTTLISIGNKCFRNCSLLSSISILINVKLIGKSCFENCSSLTSLSIPDSVKSIGINCFKGCKSLKEFSFPLTENNLYPFNVSYNEYFIFNKCGIKCKYITNDKIMSNPLIFPFNLNSGICDNLGYKPLILSNIVKIKRSHLSEDITSITIPISVSKLCNGCFKNYKKLEYITIPTTVKYIGKHLIDGCTSLTELKYEGDWNDIIVSYDDHLKFKSKGLVFNNIEYTKEDQIKYGNVIPSIVQSINQSFYNRSNQIFHIPTHITTLDNYMFHSTSGISSKLREIRIPTTIQTIPKYCFSKCYLLTKVELPTTLTSIQKKSFNKCISLTCINIPTTLIEIGIKSFKNCYSLTSINLPTPLPILRTECFKNCTSLQNILSISNDYY